jgi:uncharacterized protein YbbC (DUF1343 family)
MPLKAGDSVLPGAWRMNEYLPLLGNKKVALLINHTSLIGNTSLLDSLLKRNIKVVKVFVPEHGFRGEADAGAKINNAIDSATGLPIVSLYGDNKKPKPEQLTDVDILVYDLQDVGARFYTYISTMQYAMEACAENKKQFVILDRPNPNGHFVDGPVLKPEFKSFVGMQPVPIVYGMTVGEYAKMLKGEKWAKGTEKLNMTIIACAKYDHKTLYEPPVRPSPNLKTMAAILSYPSLCFFEGTVVSVGRGTSMPFQVWGHPDFQGKSIYSFRPVPVWGKAEPMYAYKDCYGQITAMNKEEALSLMNRKIRLIWLLRAYGWFADKEKFFNPFFEKLAGTDELRKQIIQGWDEDKIRASWQKDIAAFKKIRKKYLLYPDFE